MGAGGLPRPNLIGKNLAAVKIALKKAHCRLGKLTKKHRAHKRKGQALSRA